MRLIYLKKKKRISCQDGGIGRYTLPPCKTKRKTTTNLKTKNNQNWQKMELCGSLTTKELKKKHSSRPVGGAETGSWVERNHYKAAAGGVDCGKLFQAWEMWLSPHSEKPVGSEVGGQDPRPWISSPVGNQACIVPRLLRDLLLLRTPSP